LNHIEPNYLLLFSVVSFMIFVVVSFMILIEAFTVIIMPMMAVTALWKPVFIFLSIHRQPKKSAGEMKRRTQSARLHLGICIGQIIGAITAGTISNLQAVGIPEKSIGVQR
jgi:hypothetical protein